jgi:chromosome segregation ATPase
MWDVAQCPIRCLDEWDVFLDSVNRGIAANMLITGARESESKQYILITPQVSSAKLADLTMLTGRI